LAAEVGGKTIGFNLPADAWEDTVPLEKYTKRGMLASFYYPGYRSSACTDRTGLGRFEGKGAAALAICADSPCSHKAFAADQGITLSPLADFDKDVIDDYGVRSEAGFPERACFIFIVDREGTVRASRVEFSPEDRGRTSRRSSKTRTGPSRT
jgi:peroxiredoxin